MVLMLICESNIFIFKKPNTNFKNVESGKTDSKKWKAGH
jgi:hypothetical protein